MLLYESRYNHLFAIKTSVHQSIIPFIPKEHHKISKFERNGKRAATIFKNNLFAIKTSMHQSTMMSKFEAIVRIFSKRRRPVSVKREQLHAIEPSNSSNLGCASSTRFQLGQESREPRYRLPNSRINLRRDDRRQGGRGARVRVT